MAAMTQDRKLQIIAGSTSRSSKGKVAADAVIFKGAALVRNATGYLEPATDAAAKTFQGWAEEAVDNTGGDDGDVEVLYVTAATVKMLNDGTVEQDSVGKTCWLRDDQTVGDTAGDNPVVAGIVERLESDGVYVYGAPELKDLT